MKRRTYPYFLADFYDTSKFQMINFAIVKMKHFNSDPVISLFEICKSRPYMGASQILGNIYFWKQP